VVQKAVRVLKDPYGAYNFHISLIDSGSTPAGNPWVGARLVVGGFSECSGLEMSLETEDYQEGGNNGTVLKFPKHINSTPLRLKRGVTVSDELWLWFYSFVEGRGTRKDGIIFLLDEQRIPVKIWQFKRGLPVKWVGPSLDATRSQIAIQELEIAHEGLRMRLAV
jgi:phage tail-like protein